MPEDTQDPTPAGPEGVEEDPTPSDEQHEEQEQAEEGAKAPESVDDLPDWAQNEIRSLRAECARRRTESNELKSRLDEAKSQEDIDAAVADYQARLAQAEREVAFARHTQGLSEDLLEFVQGDTEDEIKASAQKVRAAFEARANAEPAPPAEVSGGMSPADDDEDLDPIELARRIRAANRRF